MIITLNKDERYLAQARLGVVWPPGQVVEARAVIVETLLARRRPDVPAFPWPPGTVGHRLWQISELPAEQYLKSFARRTLRWEHHPRWLGPSARKAAARMLETFPRPVRIVAVGERVAMAFLCRSYEADDDWYDLPVVQRPADSTGVEVVAIPHPVCNKTAVPEERRRKYIKLALDWARK